MSVSPKTGSGDPDPASTPRQRGRGPSPSHSHRPPTLTGCSPAQSPGSWAGAPRRAPLPWALGSAGREAEGKGPVAPMDVAGSAWTASVFSVWAARVSPPRLSSLPWADVPPPSAVAVAAAPPASRGAPPPPVCRRRRREPSETGRPTRAWARAWRGDACVYRRTLRPPPSSPAAAQPRRPGVPVAAVGPAGDDPGG